MADDLINDIEELKLFISSSKRPRVQRLLQEDLTRAEKELTQVANSSEDANGTRDAFTQPSMTAAAPVEPKQQPEGRKVSSSAREVSYTTLSTFSWDQDSEKVKIYFFIEGASKDRADVQFGNQSVDLKLRDVGGKNFHFVIPCLHERIDESRSSLLVKPKRVTLVLKKANWGHWLDLQKKEDKIKPKADVDNKDPMAGIMDLMKNMYEEGDEEMKKTIAKAWTEARVGKTTDGSKGIGDYSP
eukprot:TRINITY_DN2485_c0_g1_i1.p1 TRINITY_DN2485_c0_g1~~TRINITY_DN2485_c0_g1_i1.p1  ORF type:complete len:243 (+),score=59.34 TRINITY_DN2485_c0_g1_i1:129-857(+)